MPVIRSLSIAASTAVLLASLSAADSASAHHSFAMFDRSKDVTIEGTVKNFTWTNPHVWIDVSVMNDKGEEEVWGIETLAVGLLFRLGWNDTSLKPGDKVTVQVHPMKDGSHGGQLLKVTLPDGKVLPTTAQQPS